MYCLFSVDSIVIIADCWHCCIPPFAINAKTSYSTSLYRKLGPNFMKSSVSALTHNWSNKRCNCGPSVGGIKGTAGVPAANLYSARANAICNAHSHGRGVGGQYSVDPGAMLSGTLFLGKLPKSWFDKPADDLFIWWLNLGWLNPNQ